MPWSRPFVNMIVYRNPKAAPWEKLLFRPLSRLLVKAVCSLGPMRFTKGEVVYHPTFPEHDPLGVIAHVDRKQRLYTVVMSDLNYTHVYNDDIRLFSDQDMAEFQL